MTIPAKSCRVRGRNMQLKAAVGLWAVGSAPADLTDPCGSVPAGERSGLLSGTDWFSTRFFRLPS